MSERIEAGLHPRGFKRLIEGFDPGRPISRGWHGEGFALIVSAASAGRENLHGKHNPHSSRCPRAVGYTRTPSWSGR